MKKLRKKPTKRMPKRWLEYLLEDDSLSMYELVRAVCG